MVIASQLRTFLLPQFFPALFWPVAELVLRIQGFEFLLSPFTVIAVVVVFNCGFAVMPPPPAPEGISLKGS